MHARMCTCMHTRELKFDFILDNLIDHASTGRSWQMTVLLSGEDKIGRGASLQKLSQMYTASWKQTSVLKLLESKRKKSKHIQWFYRTFPSYMHACCGAGSEIWISGATCTTSSMMEVIADANFVLLLCTAFGAMERGCFFSPGFAFSRKKSLLKRLITFYGHWTALKIGKRLAEACL